MRKLPLHTVPYWRQSVAHPPRLQSSIVSCSPLEGDCRPRADELCKPDPQGSGFLFVQMPLRNFDTSNLRRCGFLLRCCRLRSCARAQAALRYAGSNKLGKNTMAWTTPTLVEICIGLEINGYLPAEF
jgi:coenzyme PQQ precursor peptide PqqA